MNKKILGIIFIFLSIRLLLMFTSEKSLSGDPASIAVMAMNTFKHGELNYFIYGEPYQGGAVIESYLAIPFFFFGISAFSFKLVSLIISLMVAAFIYIFVKRHFGKKAGYYAAVLVSLPPLIFTQLNVLGLSGYMETQLFFIIMTYLFYEIFYLNHKPKRNIALFGITMGFAWWNLEYALAFLLFFILFWYMLDKKFFKKRLFWIFVLSLIIFLSPLIYYNVSHNFANIKHFMAGNAIHRIACDYNLLPETMHYGDRTINPCKIFEDNVEFSSSFSLNWIYCLTTLFLIGFVLYHNRKSILPIIKSLIPLQKNNLKLKEHNKELFIIGFFLFWVLIYILSGGGTKLFFPVFPFIIILSSISLSRIKISRIKGFNVNLQLILLILLVTSALIPNVNALFKPDVENISRTIDFLKANGIKYVYTDHPRKWKILFYTQEEIVASCNICQCVNQYPRVEGMMRNDHSTAYVFYFESNIAKNLASFLSESEISYNTFEVDNNIVIYNLSSIIDPVEALTPCNWLREQG